MSEKPGRQLNVHELADAETAVRVRANVQRIRVITVVAAGLPAVVLGVVVGFAAGPVAGGAVAAVVLVAVAFVVTTQAMAIALRLVGASPVPDGSLAALGNQVEGLCATLGVEEPELWLVQDQIASSCALAHGDRSVLVVTNGLLDRLGLIEMEGVVAHELVHVKRRDAHVSATAIATAGVVGWLTRSDGLLHRAVGRGREYGADHAAAVAVRYPPGLRAALEQLADQDRGAGARAAGAGPFSGRRWAATRWIWIDPMLGDDGDVRVSALDATRVRIDALAEW